MNEQNSFEFIENPLGDSEANPFLHSLDVLKPDDMAPPKKKKVNPTAVAFAVIRWIIIAVCAGVVIWCTLYIIDSLKDYSTANDYYDNLSEMFHGDGSEAESAVLKASVSLQSSPTPDFATCLTMDMSSYNPVIEDNSGDNLELVKWKSKLFAMKEKYPNLYGWITVPNTRIDYIMMQSEDNEYYLTHTAAGDLNNCGAIFVDYRNNKTIMRNYNTVIYGHHTTSGRMFYDCDLFMNDKNFFMNNPNIVIYTLDGIYYYEVFAAAVRTKYNRYIQTGFASGEDFMDFVYEMEADSVYHREGFTVNEYDRIITLSTCANDVAGMLRIAVQAKLVKVVS